jgi:hypothetical protein
MLLLEQSELVPSLCSRGVRQKALRYRFPYEHKSEATALTELILGD